MTDLDLTRYEGHTPGPWNAQDHEDELLIFAPRHGRLGETLATLQVSDLPSSRFQKEQQQANARLIADAPLLLAEVRRLREENAANIERLAKATGWREGHPDMCCGKCHDRLAALRQSHARLLAAIKANRGAGVPLCPCPTATCAELRAAVAEAEAL